MFQNDICELLGIKYPLIQGGMAWISDASLAAAVSNAGGLGVIAGGNAEKHIIKEEIHKVKSSVNQKPYALNVMLLSPHADDMIDLVIEENVPIVITGAGSPGKYMDRLKEAGVIVIPVVASVALARRMESLGADAVIGEGTEAGGHIGELTTMALIPQLVDALTCPVIAAGGIADGRGGAAAFMLGAKGLQVGTRFITATECQAHPDYKAQVLKAKDTSAVVTGRPTGHPVRMLKNKLYRQYMALEKANAPLEEMDALGTGALRKAAREGDVAFGSVMAGQVAGLINKEESCQVIIESLINETQTIINQVHNRLK